MASFPICGRITRRRRGVRLPRDDPLPGSRQSGCAMTAPHDCSESEASELRWTNPPDFAERLAMKNYDSRTYSLNDFVAWDRQKELVLNPAFQRRAIWNDKAKSYLIDTVLRGKPIPKLFIRQKINVTTKTSIREVVDGQQRLRTICHLSKMALLLVNCITPSMVAFALASSIRIYRLRCLRMRYRLTC